MNKKKTLFLDMDGVLANFEKAVNTLYPELKEITCTLTRSTKVDEICESNCSIFHTLEPLDGAIEATKRLFELYDVYFLSTAMWNVPDSYTGKRLWVEQHFGDIAKKRLILSHRKDLCIGDILVDDRLKNGAAEFKGEHVHFGTEKFPNWSVVLPYLEKIA